MAMMFSIAVKLRLLNFNGWISTLQDFYSKEDCNLFLALSNSIVIKTAKTFSVQNLQNIRKVYTLIFLIAET